MDELRIGGLSIRLPIIQGGMGVGISLSGLASAVANQGGVGVISCAGIGLLYKDLALNYLDACIAGFKNEIRKAKESTLGVIGVNIMIALTNFEDMVMTAIKEKVDIIFAGAGLPLDLPSFLKPDSITKLVPIISSAKAARLICAKWKSKFDYLPDAFVVEGPKTPIAQLFCLKSGKFLNKDLIPAGLKKTSRSYFLISRSERSLARVL